MKIKLLRIIFAVIVMGFPLLGHAGNVIVEASCDSVQLWIGEQTDIHIAVTCDAGQKVTFPAFNDTIVRNLEIVPPVRTDTAYLDHKNRMTVTRNYTVTAFDSAFFFIPAFEVYVDSMPYRSRESVSLAVFMFPVDTLNLDQICGPKDIMSMPVKWQDISTSVYSLVLCAVLIMLAVLLFISWKNDKPVIRIIKVEPRKPAHEVALSEMERIRHEQLAHGDNVKEYYTQLTDAIRIYMEERFGFNATEMTSDEIIGQLLTIRDRESLTELRDMLQTADLVKFAKLKPLLGENDRNLLTAIEFVKETMSQEEPEQQKDEEEVVVESKRSRGSRAVLLSVAILAVTGAAFFLFVLIRELYYLLF